MTTTIHKKDMDNPIKLMAYPRELNQLNYGADDIIAECPPSNRRLLSFALSQVEDPERDAKTLLTSLVEQRPELFRFRPLIAGQSRAPQRTVLRLVGEYHQ